MNYLSCQQQLPNDAAFCPGCGIAVGSAVTGTTQRLTPVQAQRCPKCAGTMEQGFIPDEFRDRNEVSVWVRGAAAREHNGEVQLGGVEMWHITTFRCSACGYLESYASNKLEVA